jgi:hypothetical protein
VSFRGGSGLLSERASERASEASEASEAKKAYPSAAEADSPSELNKGESFCGGSGLLSERAERPQRKRVILL